MANPSDFVSRYRTDVSTFLHALDALMAARRQWDALDYGSTLPPDAFEGANSDIDLTEMTAAVSSIEAINGFMAAGHFTTLYELVL